MAISSTSIHIHNYPEDLVRIESYRDTSGTIVVRLSRMDVLFLQDGAARKLRDVIDAMLGGEPSDGNVRASDEVHGTPPEVIEA